MWCIKFPKISENKIKALISIIKALKEEKDKNNISKFFITDDAKKIPNEVTNLYVNNNGIKGHSYVYNIKNCKYFKIIL